GSAGVHHLHGSIHRYRCDACGRPHDLLDDEREAEQPPACLHCRGPVRPDVVWFGEGLPVDVLERAWSAVRACDVMLVAGPSGQVYPAAHLPRSAKQLGAAVIDVNPERTSISEIADVFLEGPSGVILPQLVALVAHGISSASAER